MNEVKLNESTPTKIIPSEKLQLFTEQWSPKIVADFNDSQIQVVKIQGEFVWHHHEDDELFIVVKGHLTIQFRDKNLEAEPGEMILIPQFVEHCPKTDEEVWIVLMDKKGTVNTGNVRSDKTADTVERI
jgi:mannose-6-phosphate isomerase-like protein (cupin superfamily)